jgi:hypothetical protein
MTSMHADMPMDASLHVEGMHASTAALLSFPQSPEQKKTDDVAGLSESLITTHAPLSPHIYDARRALHAAG